MAETDRQPRLLIFLNSKERAGVEQVALSVARGLDARGYDVHLAAPPDLLAACRPDLEGSGVHCFPVRLTSVRQWGAMRRLTAYLRRQRIEIVNSHRFYATLFAAPLARLAGTPVVIETTHGPEAWRRSWWKRLNWVDRVVETMVTMNVAVSEANRQHLLHDKRYPRHKLQMIPNGTDVSLFRDCDQTELEELRRTFGLQPKHRVLAVVARLDEQKGHHVLLEALPAVAQRYRDLRILLVGDGALRPALEKRADELGVQDHVVFTGFQPRVALFYHLAEFVVLPSLYEGMPLAAIEAGAAGKPMVATRVDGTGEVVIDGETGTLVPPRDPAALAGAILSLLDSPETAARMGKQARLRIESRFTLERQIEETDRLYRKSLDALRSNQSG